MTRNSVYITVALVGLGVAFGVLSLLVWVSRGHPGLIRHKLRVGAVMIALTAVFAGGVTHCNGRKCYAPASPEPRVYLTDADWDGSLVVDPSVSTVVVGRTADFYGTVLSFRVVDELDVAFQSEGIEASDGAFGEQYEDFEFTLSPDIPPGEYLLRFYQFPRDEQEQSPDRYIEQFDLIIL